MSDNSFLRVFLLKCAAAMLAGCVLLCAGAAASLAQGSERPRAPMLLLQYGWPVEGAPMSAVRTLDLEPTADPAADPAKDTEVVPLHAEEKFFRDSSGRTRSEIHYPGKPTTIDILDFVTHTHYRWIVGDGTYMTSAMPEPKSPRRAVPDADLPADAPMVEGVPTRHSRSVRGEAGSRETVESWYAPKLQLAMVTQIDREGYGRTTFRFQKVSLSEPDAALFQPPAEMAAENRKAPPPPAVVSQKEPAAWYDSDPKFEKAMQETRDRGISVQEQLDRWKRTVKLSRGECIRCLRETIRLQMKLGAWKDGEETAAQMEKVADKPGDKAFAQYERAQALLQSNNGKPKPAELQVAETEIQAALSAGPKNLTILWTAGRVEAMQGHDEQARQIFQRYVDAAPASDALLARAEHFVDEPHRAALPMAPPFRLISSDGRELQLDEMNGKVVLLDFWATWCGPCRETLPVIRKVAHDFAGEPLVVISISSDSDEAAWRAFVDKNQMTWTQYRDGNHALQTAYGVTAIPHFFTIDSDGVLQTEMVGADADIYGKLKKMLKKARETRPATATASSASSGSGNE